MTRTSDGIYAESKGPIPKLRAIPRACICPEPIVIDGIEYAVFSPSCTISGHGCISRYIPEVAKSVSERIRDSKKNTQVSGKAH